MDEDENERGEEQEEEKEGRKFVVLIWINVLLGKETTRLRQNGKVSPREH